MKTHWSTHLYSQQNIWIQFLRLHFLQHAKSVTKHSAIAVSACHRHCHITMTPRPCVRCRRWWGYDTSRFFFSKITITDPPPLVPTALLHWSREHSMSSYIVLKQTSKKQGLNPQGQKHTLTEITVQQVRDKQIKITYKQLHFISKLKIVHL